MFPLAIRITKNRRSTYKNIGHYIDIEDWDEKNLRVKKSHPNAKSLNSILSSKLTEVNKSLMNLQSEGGDVSATQIKRNIYKPVSSLTFFDYVKEHLDTLEADKVVSKDLYPFGKGSFKIKFPQTIKIGLNKEEITKLEKFQNLSEVQRHALNVWLFSFWTCNKKLDK
ncbi:Arm DNA-binding domain-containing protein [Galbibacter sp. BG1]